MLLRFVQPLCRDMARTGIAVLAPHRIRAAAHAAFAKAREQMAGPVGWRSAGSHSPPAPPRIVPPAPPATVRRPLHDAKLGNLDDDPVGRRVEPRHPPSRLRVLHPEMPVPLAAWTGRTARARAGRASSPPPRSAPPARRCRSRPRGATVRARGHLRCSSTLPPSRSRCP